MALRDEWQHANSVPITERYTGSAVLVVEQGPGWVELWSPNAAIRWKVTSKETRVTENIYIETGPASKARVWVGRGGCECIIEQVRFVMNGTNAVDQASGRIISNLDAKDRARANARFVPSDAREDYEGPTQIQTGPLLGQGVTCYVVEIPKNTTLEMGYPPEQRYACTIVSVDNFLVELDGGPFGASVPLWSEPGVANNNVTIPVSPCEFLSIENTSTVNPIIVRLLWQDFGPVQMT